jgi:rRNA maturation protein Nop10
MRKAKPMGWLRRSPIAINSAPASLRKPGRKASMPITPKPLPNCGKTLLVSAPPRRKSRASYGAWRAMNRRAESATKGGQRALGHYHQYVANYLARRRG